MHINISVYQFVGICILVWERERGHNQLNDRNFKTGQSIETCKTTNREISGRQKLLTNETWPKTYVSLSPTSSRLHIMEAGGVVVDVQNEYYRCSFTYIVGAHSQSYRLSCLRADVGFVNGAMVPRLVISLPISCPPPHPSLPPADGLHVLSQMCKQVLTNT